MKSHTVYKTFTTDERRAFVRITEDVQAAVDEADVAEGMVLVSAMHITAGVWVNDDEPGIQADALEWLDKLAPPSWKEPANEVARELLPDPGDYRHHRGGEQRRRAPQDSSSTTRWFCVTGSVGEAGDGRAVLELEAAQGDQRIIRNGEAEITTV